MNRIVYDSDNGNLVCPACQRAAFRCKCKPTEQADPQAKPDDNTVRLRHEMRRGKPVTVVTGLPMADSALREFAKILKKKCSTGGAVKDRQIELQGDHREFLLRELKARNYTVKLAGGKSLFRMP